tara:strand:- start:177 stop:587 length:411 start_codon:yes stop_codon:yes gene_type:complete
MRANVKWNGMDDWDWSFIEQAGSRTLIKVETDYFIYKIEKTGYWAGIHFGSGIRAATIYSDFRSNRQLSNHIFHNIKLTPKYHSFTDENGVSLPARDRMFKDGHTSLTPLKTIIGWLEGEVEHYRTDKGTVLFLKE